MSKKLKLSPWHDGSVKPVHVGVYERSFPNTVFKSNYYTYWDGDIWRSNNTFIPSKASHFLGYSFLQHQKWRGVLK